MCAGFQRRHSGLFSDGAGEDDEREIQPACLKDRQCLRRGELREAVVGEHQIPRRPLQRRLHRLWRLHSLVSDVVAAPFEGAQDHRCIVGRIFD